VQKKNSSVNQSQAEQPEESEEDTDRQSYDVDMQYFIAHKKPDLRRVF
jgi:hypothetical protein